MTVNTGTLRFPSTTDFPSTSTYPGQGTGAWWSLLYSTDNFNSSTPTWVDASPDLRTFSTARGRQTELDEVDAGTATFSLDNQTREYDPVNNTGIRPRNRWWLREQFNGATNDVFKGYAEAYQQTWPDGMDAVAVVSCTDELAVLARAHVPTMDPPRNTYADLVGFDNPTNYWRWSDANMTSTTTMETIELPTFHWTYNGFEWDTVTTPHMVQGFQDWTVVNGVGFASSFSTNPIAGDLQSISEGLGGYLDMQSTGPFSIVANSTDIGDPMGGTAYTVETWFQKTGNPGGNTAFMHGPESTSAGTMTWALELNTTGVVVFRINDSGGTQRTVTSNTALSNNVWYHLVAELDGANLRIFINGVQDNTAGSGTGSFRPTNAAGAPTQINGIALVTSISLDETAFYLKTALPVARALAHYQAGALRGYRGGSTVGLAHLRATDVLDSISSHAPRNIRTGTRGMQPVFQAGQDPLTELKKCALAEMPEGLLFVAADGEITLLDAAYKTVAPWSTVQLTFDDDGTDLPYTDLTPDYSDSYLANRWDLSRTGGDLDSSSDQASIDQYGDYPKSVTDLPLTSDADVTTIGDALLAKYKQPQSRILSLKPLMANVDVLDGVMRREIGDKIEVFRTPPGGGTRLDQALWIQRIEISGEPGRPPDVTLGVGNPSTGGAAI